MFGSKLRSWMENHIVRSRKKGNKNKNASSNAVGLSSTSPPSCSSHDVYKKSVAGGIAIYHRNSTTTAGVGGGGTSVGSGGMLTAQTSINVTNGGMSGNNSISSPVRRREVSPIQSQSRYGWQSPDQDIVASPKSDNFLYVPQHLKQQHNVRAQQHHTAPNSKENSYSECFVVSQQQKPHSLSQSHSQPQQYHQKSQHQKQQLKKHPPDCSSSSISSLSWSTGSKEPTVKNKNQLTMQYQQQQQKEQLGVTAFDAVDAVVGFHSSQDESGNDITHYEEICTILRHPDNINNNNFTTVERPKSEQLGSYTSTASHLTYESCTQDDASTRYGRLLPSKMDHQFASGSIDSLNGNQLRIRSVECIMPNNPNCKNNTYQLIGASGTTSTGSCMNTMNCHNMQTSGLQRNRLRASRLTNPAINVTNTGSSIRSNGASALGIVLPNSLSSPESAYSTGYSTDGTSPGAIYTPPEYYINMRTGTHYFPKSINSLAIEAQRYKFGLNKIEEMSPIEPQPKHSFGNANVSGIHLINDPYVVIDNNKLSSYPFNARHEENGNQQLISPTELKHLQRPVPHSSPLTLRNSIILPTLKGFESPSPRQRCRIRTNPWYSTTDTSSSGATMGGNSSAIGQNLSHPCIPNTTSSSTISSSQSVQGGIGFEATPMKMDLDVISSTSSSGIKSSNETATGSSGQANNRHNGAPFYESSASSSSLTEVENMQKTYSPNTIRRKQRSALSMHPQQQHADEYLANGIGIEHESGVMLCAKRTSKTTATTTAIALAASSGSNDSANGDGDPHVDDAVAECQDILVSDDDATLNEMMGKFDESYVYEKETDILSSDSDLTDCPSDLDTGQDAGDECDTDELLDIDFIDTSSIQEVHDKRDLLQRNLGSCIYYSSPTRVPHQQMESLAPVRTRRSSRSVKIERLQQVTSAVGTKITATITSIGSCQRRRKRFHKTRKKSSESRCNEQQQQSPVRISRESRSVGGTPVCLRRKYRSTRERIYKTSPLSNRSSSLVFTEIHDNRCMTIAESEKALLRADLEADVKYRQLILEAESILTSMRNSTQSIQHETPVASPRRLNPLANKRVEMLKNCELETKREQLKQQQKQLQQRSLDAEQELVAAINRRIELLKYETKSSASAPTSPKFVRLSPRKTHLTNFINQNIPPDVTSPSRRSLPTPQSPQLHLNGRHMVSSANGSPQGHRRFPSQSHKLNDASNNDSDSDADYILAKQMQFQHDDFIKRPKDDFVKEHYLPRIAKMLLFDQNDYNNRNAPLTAKKSALVSFNSIDGPASNYCPQSEPLKRKVYKGSSTFERIKKSFDLESEIPKQALLAKINNMRRERLNSNTKLSVSLKSSQDLNPNNESYSMGTLMTTNDEDAIITSNLSSCGKKQLILSTIADLKRSLENQSVELNGLNED